MSIPLRLSLALFGLLALSVAQAETQAWPRSIETSHGVITLKQPPQRIVSTSVTVTGTLLAIDAPVIASGATSPNNRLSDRQGFFHQWGEIAAKRGVKRLYIGEPNAEAIAGEAPDLIVMSATGTGISQRWQECQPVDRRLIPRATAATARLYPGHFATKTQRQHQPRGA